MSSQILAGRNRSVRERPSIDYAEDNTREADATHSCGIECLSWTDESSHWFVRTFRKECSSTSFYLNRTFVSSPVDRLCRPKVLSSNIDVQWSTEEGKFHFKAMPYSPGCVFSQYQMPIQSKTIETMIDEKICRNDKVNEWRGENRRASRTDGNTRSLRRQDVPRRTNSKRSNAERTREEFSPEINASKWKRIGWWEWRKWSIGCDKESTCRIGQRRRSNRRRSSRRTIFSKRRKSRREKRAIGRRRRRTPTQRHWSTEECEFIWEFLSLFSSSRREAKRWSREIEGERRETRTSPSEWTTNEWEWSDTNDTANKEWSRPSIERRERRVSMFANTNNRDEVSTEWMADSSVDRDSTTGQRSWHKDETNSNTNCSDGCWCFKRNDRNRDEEIVCRASESSGIGTIKS